jgi:molybdenum cofactor biosynthesis enzyme MoaA
MSVDQIGRLCKAALESGVREIKLTGGEPLLYRHSGQGIVDVVHRIASLRRHYAFGLSMTTNALLLSVHADALSQAGLDRVTVSLHTLKEKTLRTAVYQGGSKQTFERVISGIEAARQAGLAPLKMNTVLFDDAKGSAGNLGEVGGLVALCRRIGVDELRLYTLLSHQRFSGQQFSRRYRFWNRATLDSLAMQLAKDSGEAAAIAMAGAQFVEEWRRVLYPKAALQFRLDGLAVGIEAMEDGRFAEAGLSAEGAYAIRLSAAGVLRGALEGGRAKPLLGLLRSGASERDLVEAFSKARATLLPTDPSIGAIMTRPFPR